MDSFDGEVEVGNLVFSDEETEVFPSFLLFTETYYTLTSIIFVGGSEASLD